MYIYVLFSTSGITNFNGYWGCERCRTRGISVQNQSDAQKSRQIANRTGYASYNGDDEDGDGDDDINDGEEAPSAGGLAASAGGGPAAAGGRGAASSAKPNKRKNRRRKKKAINIVGNRTGANGDDEAGDSDDANDDGVTPSAGGLAAPAGGGRASAGGQGAAQGRGAVKFPQLDAPLRKDVDWHLYKYREPTEPNNKVSDTIYSNKYACSQYTMYPDDAVLNTYAISFLF